MGVKRMAKKTGRRDKYKTHVAPRLKTIIAWRRKGVTIADIAKNLDVALSSLFDYQNKHPELLDALNIGAEDAIAQVEDAVFKTALGYQYTETKVVYDGFDDPKKVAKLSQKERDKLVAEGKCRVETYTKSAAPNTTAQIFYLTNRASDFWRHKNSLEHTGPNGTPLATGTVQFVIPDNGRGGQWFPGQKAPRGAVVKKQTKKKGGA